jgi:hypothetical protein
MKRTLGKIVIGLIAALAVIYVGDWAVWRFRVAMGGGMSTVSVSSIIVTRLKDNKDEYDWDGTADVACSRSIFPQAGSGACWWLRRHKVIYEQ